MTAGIGRQRLRRRRVPADHRYVETACGVMCTVGIFESNRDIFSWYTDSRNCFCCICILYRARNSIHEIQKTARFEGYVLSLQTPDSNTLKLNTQQDGCSLTISIKSV